MAPVRSSALLGDSASPKTGGVDRAPEQLALLWRGEVHFAPRNETIGMKPKRFLVFAVDLNHSVGSERCETDRI